MNSGADLGTILSIWAHPDDETYLCAGLMARAVRSGARVVCVTATRGELGSSDPERWPPGAPLAKIRTEELHRALGSLGISEHHWLDYPDGGCADVPPDAAVARLRSLVQDVRPQTVLTFGPEGMTGHPDHQAVSRWTTEAVAGSGASLHYATNTPEWLARFRGPLDELGAFMGSEPPCTTVEDLSVHIRLDGELLDLKLAAILHQTSQVEATVAALGEIFLREGLAEESFRAAD